MRRTPPRPFDPQPATPPLRLAVLAVVLLGAAIPAEAALNININAGSALANNQPALDAFDRAAAQWESAFSDPVTVTIDADLNNNFPSPSILGSTSSVPLNGDFDTYRDEMVIDAEGDDGIVNALPSSAQFSATLPTGFSLGGRLAGTKANFKALGVTGLDSLFGTSDASISFNSDFTFDFDNSDGVDAGAIDFETVAAHEIAHALGFVSVVDQIDFAINNGTTGTVNPTFLDLFRFENGTVNDPETAAEFTSTPRNLSPGVEAISDFIQPTMVGGNVEVLMATGSTQGDGRQASHWKDNLGLGLMDPTLASGETVPISEQDLRALDLIGFDFAPVPEPSSTAIVLCLVVAFAGGASRRGTRRSLSTRDAGF